VQLGTLDLTLTSTGPLPNFVPDVAILDIPFLFSREDRDQRPAIDRQQRAVEAVRHRGFLSSTR